jgi:hypothetical protein
MPAGDGHCCGARGIYIQAPETKDATTNGMTALMVQSAVHRWLDIG